MSEQRSTNRWRGALVFATLAVAVGLTADRPALLVVAGVGVVYALYPSASPFWTPALEVERTLSEPAPANGERVTVETTVRNVGSRPILDLRFVDGVPPALSVVGGSARRGGTLLPGRATTLTYEVAAKRGKHRFQPATAVVRDLSGARELETTVGEGTEIDCTAGLDRSPLRPQTLDYVGRILSGRTGAGIEFDRTREYAHGDSKSRIDWRGFARTNELATVEFRTERAVTAVVVVDARASAYRATDDDVHAVGLCVSAAEQLLSRLIGDHNRVGLACFGRSFAWVPADTGRDHLVRARETLASDPAVHPSPPQEDVDAGAQFASFRERLPDGAQVVVLSPLCDDWIVATALKLEAHGYPVSVVSPSVVAGGTLGRQFAAVERSNRVAALRSADVPVVEWDPTVPLGRSVAATRPGWSA